MKRVSEVDGKVAGGPSSRADELISRLSRADVHATAQRSRAKASASVFAGTTVAALAAGAAAMATGSMGGFAADIVVGIVVALWAVTGITSARDTVECRRAEAAHAEAAAELEGYRNGRSHDGGQVR